MSYWIEEKEAGAVRAEEAQPIITVNSLRAILVAAAAATGQHRSVPAAVTAGEPSLPPVIIAAVRPAVTGALPTPVITEEALLTLEVTAEATEAEEVEVVMGEDVGEAVIEKAGGTAIEIAIATTVAANIKGTDNRRQDVKMRGKAMQWRRPLSSGRPSSAEHFYLTACLKHRLRAAAAAAAADITLEEEAEAHILIILLHPTLGTKKYTAGSTLFISSLTHLTRGLWLRSKRAPSLSHFTSVDHFSRLLTTHANSISEPGL